MAAPTKRWCLPWAGQSAEPLRPVGAVAVGTAVAAAAAAAEKEGVEEGLLVAVAVVEEARGVAVAAADLLAARAARAARAAAAAVRAAAAVARIR